MIIALTTPVLGIRAEDVTNEEESLKWKAIISIGRINVCFQENIIDGFVIIGYNVGEIILFEQIFISNLKEHQ